MMVNCLPLFQMRLENVQDDSAGVAVVATSTAMLAQSTGSPVSQCEINKRRRGTKAERRFVLKKSASTENILTPSTPPPEKSKRSSEAEDVLDQQGKESVHVQRETWAHFTKSADYSIHVSNPVSIVVPPQVIAESASPEKTSEIEKLSGEGKNREGEKKEGAEMVDGSVEGVSGEGEGASKVEGEGEQTRGKRGGGGSEGKSAQVLSDGGSDGEEAREMRVSYIENPEQMQTLKRSSGSVSFFGNSAAMIPVAVTHSPLSPSVVKEDRGEDVDGGQVSVAVCGMGMGEGVSGNGELVDEKSEAIASGEEKEKDVAEGEREEVGTKAEREQTDTENGVGAATSADESTAKQREEREGSSEKAVLAQAPSQQPQPQPNAPSQPPVMTSPQTSQQNVPQPTGQLLPSHPVVTPLPPPPMTFEPEFIERSGWLTKLSHRKGGRSGQSMQQVLIGFIKSSQ